MDNYEIITDEAGVARACEHFEDHRWVGLDIETTDLNPLNGVIRLVQLSDGESTYMVDLSAFGDPKTCKELGPLRAFLSKNANRKVAHNAKFDAKWIMHHFGVEVGGIFCTYIASHLLAAGDTDRRHSLAEAAQYFLGIQVDKTEQASDWGAQELDPAQLEYAAKDAAILVPLKDRMYPELEKDGLVRVAELENECIIPVCRMELNGFFLDIQAWQGQYQRVEKQAKNTETLLRKILAKGHPQPEFMPGCFTINLDSATQVGDALKNCGVPVGKSTEEWRLAPLARKFPEVGVLLDYRGLSKAMSSYGMNWANYIHPSTGRIHAEFDPIRAKTGRFGCSKPNLQQIPHESEYRWCFKAGHGNKLVIADYSQIELRILAHRSMDQRFMAAFNSGVDLHTATAAQVFDIPVEDVTPDQRSFAKRLNFGLVYGISARKFAMLTGLEEAEATELMRKYFATFSGLNAYLRDEARQSVVDRVCRTESGRMMRLRFDDQDKGSVAAAMRNGVNTPIQGTSADILKRALRLLHNNIKGTSARLVNIVHDEIIVECEAGEAKRIAKILERVMIRAGQEFVTRVPIEVDAHIADEWRK